MSNRRARVSRMSEDEITDLISKIQALLPAHSTSTCSSTVVKEACKYIKKLHKEVDDLSERLSQLLASGDITSTDANIITRLSQQ